MVRSEYTLNMSRWLCTHGRGYIQANTSAKLGFRVPGCRESYTKLLVALHPELCADKLSLQHGPSAQALGISTGSEIEK